MKLDIMRVPTRFAPETRFELRPEPPAPFRAMAAPELDRLKDRMLVRYLATADEPTLGANVRRAANEAAALAWATPYPLLVFPVLFEEKLQYARELARRQETVRRRSLELMAVL